MRSRVLAQASGLRCGVVPAVQHIEATFAEPAGLYNACVVGDTASTLLAASGGLGRSREAAVGAALGEALERYAASNVPLSLRRSGPGARALEDGSEAELVTMDELALFSEAQRASPGFPFPRPRESEVRYACAYDALDGRAVWVPHELVSLGPREGDARVPSTSTGLAAAPSPIEALLRALEEVLERDAFSTYWLNGLGGRELALEGSYRAPIDELGGSVRCFDLSQRWNPHPVVVVCGQIPMRGRPRVGLGAACRARFADALEKAWLEWVQGVIFAGYWVNEHPGRTFPSPSDVRDFDAHGGYYSVHPERWERVPLLRRARAQLEPPRDAAWAAAPSTQQTEHLVKALGRTGIRVLYRDLTTCDVEQTGLRVLRVICPALTPLHGDEQIPFLGGRTRDWRWRFPDAPEGDDVFPSTHPHPLG